MTTYPNARVRLSDEDGNVFAIIGRCRGALRRAGVPDAEINEWSREASAQPSYDAVLQFVMKSMEWS